MRNIVGKFITVVFYSLLVDTYQQYFTFFVGTTWDDTKKCYDSDFKEFSQYLGQILLDLGISNILGVNFS